MGYEIDGRETDPVIVPELRGTIDELRAENERLRAENEAVLENSPYPYCHDCNCETRTCDEDGLCSCCGTEPEWPTAATIAERDALRAEVEKLRGLVSEVLNMRRGFSYDDWDPRARAALSSTSKLKCTCLEQRTNEDGSVRPLHISGCAALDSTNSPK